MEQFKQIGNKAIRRIGYGLLAIGMLCGCGNKYQYIPKDIEPISIEIVRFDNAQLGVRPDSVKQDIKKLYDDYESFMPIFVEGILGIPTEDTAYLCEMYAQFLTDTAMGFAQTNAKAQSLFANVDSLQETLNIGFTRLHHLYPDWKIPTLYLFVSGFNSSVMYYEDIVGVGIDMYLGSEYPYYNQVVHNYQKTTMRKECLSRDVLNFYLDRHISYTSQQNRLLEQMIYCGKKIYLLGQILPQQSPWNIIGYTKAQWDWCVANEQAIWNRVMDKRDLFKTESMLLTSYLREGPFTSEISRESPGRLGIWIGWRIVDQYMRNNKQVSLQALMSDGDAQKILEQSKYKP